MSDTITRTFTTRTPDKPGAFMLACKVIMENNGNITRVSFNKGSYNLFIEVEATKEQLKAIDKGLSEISYVDYVPQEPIILVMEVKITDTPGSLFPVLKVISNYDVNISYLNSRAENRGYQNFNIGMEVKDPEVSKKILDEVAELYALNVVSYNGNYDDLDITVKYIHLANTIQKLFSLDDSKVIEFISESKKIAKVLKDRDVDSKIVFDDILRLANFIAYHRDLNFKPRMKRYDITDETYLVVIEPPCGSNTYVLRNDDSLLFIDSGMGIYSDEMITELREMFPSFFSMKKTMLVTHADADHCGLLSVIENADILVNKKTADKLKDISGSVRESDNVYSYCYGKLGRIITDYSAPDQNSVHILGKDVPEEHDDLRLIDKIQFGDLTLEAYEGPGGHLDGEMVYLCREHKLLFTGDIYANLKDLIPEREEFNDIAPFFLTNVDEDPAGLDSTRKQLGKIMDAVGRDGMIVCGGHGNIKKL